EAYYDKNRQNFGAIEFVEQDIQLNMDDGILVTGTIDLIKKKRVDGKYETTIIEFKSKEEVQKRAVTYDQLELYALGHRDLTGEVADYIQIYDVTKNVSQPQKVLKPSDLEGMKQKIITAADVIRNVRGFPKINQVSVCKDCLQKQICLTGIRLL